MKKKIGLEWRACHFENAPFPDPSLKLTILKRFPDNYIVSSAGQRRPHEICNKNSRTARTRPRVCIRDKHVKPREESYPHALICLYLAS